MKWPKSFRILVCLAAVSWAAPETTAQNKGYDYSGPCRLGAFSPSAQLFPVTGRVIDDVTGAGIAGATVRLNSICLQDRASAERMKQETVTDEGGNFSFQDLPMIAVNIVASKGDGDYLEVWPFRHRAEDPIRTYKVGPDSGPIILRIAPAASISGIVRDEVGTPVGDAWVSLLAYRTWEGWPRLEFWNTEKTKPDGSYRRGSLPPGRYYLITSPDPYRTGVPFAKDKNGNALGLVPARFPQRPDTQDEDAFLELAEGQHLQVDFQLFPQVVYHITGRIEGGGKWGATLQAADHSGAIYFVKAPPLCCEFETWVPNGKFRFTGGWTSAEGSFTASHPFDVHDADVSNVVVPIARQSETSIPIQITISPQQKPSCLETQMGCGFFYVWLIRHIDNGYFEAGSNRSTLLQPNRDGAFSRESVTTLSGTYSVVVSASLNVYAEDIVRNSTNLVVEPLVIKPGDTGDPIQIVLAEGSVIEGTTMGSGKAAKSWVYAIPESPDGRLFHATTSDTQGKFRIEGLAPAEYTFFATDVELGINLFNPKEVEYWHGHGQHFKLQRGRSNQIVLQQISFPAELYPQQATPREGRDSR